MANNIVNGGFAEFKATEFDCGFNNTICIIKRQFFADIFIFRLAKFLKLW